MRIAVDAYFNNNLGDDLFLDILVNRYNDVSFDFMVCDKSACKAFRDNRRINFKSRKDVLYNIMNYNAYILIGGSMFQEPENWITHWRKFHLTVSLFKLFGKSTFVLGCNFGPFKTEKYKKKYCKTFKKLSHMTVRDDYSYNILKDHVENLTVHPDIVFCKGISENINKNTNIVGISIIDWPKNNHLEEYISFNASLIEGLISEGKKIRLFAFQNTNEINDRKIIDKVIKKIRESFRKNIEVISYNGDISSFLKKYSECHSMVTSRFHSFILSLMYGQNICPIIYSEKTLNTIKFLGIDTDYIPIEKVSETSIQKVKDMLKTSKHFYQDKSINQLAKMSEQHFSVLDSLFKK
jgi:colanic acid/amylovoran biosynthesis protein